MAWCNHEYPHSFARFDTFFFVVVGLHMGFWLVLIAVQTLFYIICVLRGVREPWVQHGEACETCAERERTAKAIPVPTICHLSTMSSVSFQHDVTSHSPNTEIQHDVVYRPDHYASRHHYSNG